MRRSAPGRSIARLWLLTEEQLADVAAQECALAPGELDVDVEAVVARRSVVLSTRRYGRLVHLGHRDGLPIVTMTSPSFHGPAEPGVDYLAIVRAGLAECGLSPDEAEDYLRRRPGWVGAGGPGTA